MIIRIPNNITIRIPIKGLIVFSAIIIVGLFFLGKIDKNKKATSSPDSSFVASSAGSSSAGSANILTNRTREIKVTARQFSFRPNPIKVKLGEMVRLRIRSVDVAHGFSLPEFGVNEVLRPGKEVTVEFQATRKGRFQFFCSIACGAGHSGMRGVLIVE